MTLPLPLGRLLAAPTIERGVEVCLRYFLPMYVGEVLTQAGHDRAGLPNPADLVRVAEFEWPAPTQLALVVLASPGTSGEPVAGPESYSATWDVRVAVLADLGDRLETREAAQLYAAAVGAAVSQQGVASVNADGTWAVNDDGMPEVLAGSSVRWAGEAYRQIGPPAAGRALIAGEARLLVTIEDARARWSATELALPGPPDERTPPPVPGSAPVVPSLTITRDPVEDFKP